jgi:cell division protein FtsN
MEQANNQRELFGQAPQEIKPRFAERLKISLPVSNFKINLTAQSLIFCALAVIFLNLVTFSLGVLRGKTLVTSQAAKNEEAALKEDRQSKSMPAEMSKEIPAAVKPEIIIPKAKEIDKPAVSPVEKEAQKYVIQVASFRSVQTARKVLAKLKKDGVSSYLQTKGQYTVVCAGNFKKQMQAKLVLAQLKKEYGDCLIKKIR